MIPYESLLIMPVRLFDRTPLLLPPIPGHWRAKVYPDRLLLKDFVTMIVRYLREDNELLGVLE
jgi:hypothetical protein